MRIYLAGNNKPSRRHQRKIVGLLKKKKVGRLVSYYSLFEFGLSISFFLGRKEKKSMIYYFSIEDTGGGGRQGKPSGEKKINTPLLIEGLGGRGIRYMYGAKEGNKSADRWSIPDFRYNAKITSPELRKTQVSGFKR